MAALVYVVLPLNPKAAFGRGWLWGLALFLGQLHWITVSLTVYGNLAWPLAIAGLLFLACYLALYPALFCALLAHAKRAGIPLWLAAPPAWAGLEWLRGVALTGFPWMPFANGLSGEPALIQSAEFWGVEGLSGLAALAAVLLALVFSAKGRKKPAAALALAALLVGGWLWGQARMDQVADIAQKAPRLVTSVIQGNVPIGSLWDKEKRMGIIKSQLALTEQAAKGVTQRPWLVVWSESAAPFFFYRDGAATMEVLKGAARLKADLIFGTMGVVKQDGQMRPTNRTWLVDSRGGDGGYYDKVHLVPFGEYVPLGRILFFVRALATVSQDHVPGNQGHTLKAGRVALGPLICYESIFAELARAQRKRGALLMINQTNDAWFGGTGASSQHLSHLKLRCVENRMACARAANTGISGFVLPDGTTKKLTPMFVEAEETMGLPLMKTRTIYTEYGGLVGPVCLGAAFLTALLALARRRNKY